MEASEQWKGRKPERWQGRKNKHAEYIQKYKNANNEERNIDGKKGRTKEKKQIKVKLSN